MQTSTNKSTKEQIYDIIQFILKNWYYFVIGFGICGIIGIIHLKTATRIWNVRAQVGLRHDESIVGGSISKASSLMSSFGLSSGSESIEDETLKLSSQGNMKKLVQKYNLNKVYIETKYFGLSKKNLYDLDSGDKPPVLLTVDSNMADTISTTIEFSLKIRNDGSTVKMKAGKKKVGTYELGAYPATIETPWGKYTFEKSPDFEKYDQPSSIKISFYNYDAMAQIYQQEIFIDYQKRTSDLINISYNHENTYFAKKMVNEVIDIYNQEWIEDKELVSYNTIQYIDDRLLETQRLLSHADQSIEEFKNKNNLTQIDADVKYYLTLSGELQAQLLQAETQLSIASIIMDFVQDEKNKYSLIPFDLTLADANMVSAINSYNSQLVRRNDMLKDGNAQSALIQSLSVQIDLQRNNLITSLKNIQQGMQISLNNLRKKEHEFNSKLKNVPALEKDYLSLKRDQGLQQTIYTFLLEMREQSAVKGVNILPKLKMISAPYTSNGRVSPSKFATISTAFFCGLILSLVFAFGIPYYKTWRKKKNK